MADFRKAKYSGSLNLAPECGPVLIELDTEAKTATASLEDPASQYTLAGGGGGLEYVIPEQTVTLTSSTNFVEIEADFSSIIGTDDSAILAFTEIEDGFEYKTYLQLIYDGEQWSGENLDGLQAVVKNENGVWKFNIITRISYPFQTIISAIRGF